MATPNQIMARVYAMRANRIAMQSAVKEKEQEMWAKMSPMDRHVYLQLKASRQALPVMTVMVIAVLGIVGIISWLGG